MAAPSWIRLPRGTIILLLLALHLSLSLAAQFEGFDSDELSPATAADLASADDDEEGLHLDVHLPPPPPISVSVSAPSPPVTTTTAENPNLLTPPNPTPSLDFWDEDEFEGIPVPEAPKTDASATPAESTPSEPSSGDAASSASYKRYTVLLERPPQADIMDDGARNRLYESFLPSNLTDSGEPRMVATFNLVFHGFTAWLTEAELDVMSKKPGFRRWMPDEWIDPDWDLEDSTYY